MTSKNYKSLIKDALKETKKHQIEPSNPERWRRSEYGYASPAGPTFYADVGEMFEIMSSCVVNADDRITGKNLHGCATVRRAFADAGLDPRKPNDWHEVLQIFTDAHYLKRPIRKRITRPKLDEIKKHAESIREKRPGISKTSLIDEMKSSSKKYPSESTLAKQLHKAGVRWYAQPTKKRSLKKSK